MKHLLILLLFGFISLAVGKLDRYGKEEVAPTDASFRRRYYRMMHSHNPMFGVMGKYFLRNRAQEREKRDAQPAEQQLYYPMPYQTGYSYASSPNFLRKRTGSENNLQSYAARPINKTPQYIQVPSTSAVKVTKRQDPVYYNDRKSEKKQQQRKRFRPQYIMS